MIMLLATTEMERGEGELERRHGAFGRGEGR